MRLSIPRPPRDQGFICLRVPRLQPPQQGHSYQSDPRDRFALQRKRKQREERAAKEPQVAESVAGAGHRLGKLVVQGPALL